VFVAYHDDEYLRRAERALRWVGDPDHEWRQLGGVATHLRRRCSPAEVERYGLVVRDVRGTPEAEARLAPVRHLLPPGYTEA
jgi:hypothetical protein